MSGSIAASLALAETPLIVPWMQTLLWTSFYASLMALALLALQPMLRRQIPARWRFGLWLLVLLRFVPLPLPQSSFSLYNWLPHAQAAAVSEPIAPPKPPTALAVSAPVLSKQARPEQPINVQPSISASPAVEMNPKPMANVPAHNSPSPVSAISIAQPKAFPWSSLIVALYFLGAAVVLLRLLFSSFALRRIVRHAQPLDDGTVRASLAGVCKTLGVRRDPTVLATDAIASPALVGVITPRLLLPRKLLPLLSADELRLVFLHEIAHLRRRDVTTNYAIAAVTLLHWFNPILWLILPLIRAERELACDELVLHHTGQPALYGHTLLKLLQAAPQARSLAPAVGIVESRSYFSRRIQMIANFKKHSAWTIIPAGVVLALAAACAMTSPLSNAAAPSSPAPVPTAASSGTPSTSQPVSIKTFFAMLQLENSGRSDVQQNNIVLITAAAGARADGVIPNPYGFDVALSANSKEKRDQAVDALLKSYKGTRIDSLSPEQIAMSDDKMRALLNEAHHQEQLKSTAGLFGEANPDLPVRREALADANAKVQQYQAEYMLAQSAVPVASSTDQSSTTKPASSLESVQTDATSGRNSSDPFSRQFNPNATDNLAGFIRRDTEMQTLENTKLSLEQERAAMVARGMPSTELNSIDARRTTVEEQMADLKRDLTSQFSDEASYNKAKFIRNDPEWQTLENTKLALQQENAALVARGAPPTELNASDARRKTVDEQIATLKADLAKRYAEVEQDKAVANADAQRPNQMSPEQIATTDTKMRALLDDADSQQQALAQLANLGDTNAAVIRQKNLVAAAQARVQRYLDDYSEFHRATAQAQQPVAPAVPVADNTDATQIPMRAVSNTDADSELRMLRSTKDALEQERAAAMARHATPVDMVSLDARLDTVTMQIKKLQDQQAHNTQAAVAAKTAASMVQRVYDVHDILDVPDDQKGPLTSDQRNAMKDLGETLKNVLDPNAVMSTFNGVVILNASEDVHNKVVDLLRQLEMTHHERADELRQRAQQGKSNAN